MNISPVNYSTNYKSNKSVNFGNYVQHKMTPSMLSDVQQGSRIGTSPLRQFRAQLHLSSFDCKSYFSNLYQRCRSNFVKGNNTIN